MPWTQISVLVNGDIVGDITEVFQAAGALSVTSMDAGDEPLLEPAPGETPLWEQVRLVALMEPGVDMAALSAELVELFPAATKTMAAETLDDRDWSNTWRESFAAMSFGNHLWIVPSGEEINDDDAVVVNIDPGLAFGTGTHATTAMCLRWLDAHPPVGASVIDYGCGSGILSIAAGKLGAASVHAVDIDPQAQQATRENARRNEIDRGLEVMLPTALEHRCFDLVIANILANPLIELSGRLTSYLAQGGHIIMTGILAEQAEAVMSAYRESIVFDTPVSCDGWVLLAGRKQ